jgi:hypothetical protein
MASEEQLQIGRAQAKENATVNVSLTQLEQPKFTNLKLQRDIILGDFIFNTIDDYGVVWVVTDIDGWWAPPKPDMPDIPRGFGDGSYDVQGRYTARTLNLKGSFLTPDPSMVEAARDRLTQATDLVYRGTWLLAGADPIRASFVRLEGDVKIQTVNPRGRTDFEISLRAPDPIKYAWNDSQPDGYEIVEIPAAKYGSPLTGSGTIVNTGNYRVPVILEVSGPVVAPATIYNRTTDQLIIITSGFGGSLSARVENVQLSFNPSTLEDLATITTRQKHGFSVGSEITVSGIDEIFDGVYTIKSIPTETTLTYARVPEVSVIRQVLYKSLISNIATIETTTNHGFIVGDQVLLSNVDDVFNGTYQITSVPSNTSFTYQNTRVPVASITGRILTSNIATLTTSAPHGFLVGEQVTVLGVDEINFNGTYTISATSSDGLRFSYAKNRTDSKAVIRSEISLLQATMVTSGSHGFVQGEQVNISGVSQAYDGTFTIVDIPSSNTFIYRRDRSTRQSVISKAIAANTATLTTGSPHGVTAGEKVIVSGVDSTFDGQYLVTSTPSSTAISYAKTGSVIPTVVVGGAISPSSRWVTRRNLIGSVATLTTLNAHGILVGETVTVQGVGAPFDGIYQVTDASQNTFSYTKASANVSDASTAFAVTAIERSGTTATITTNVNHGIPSGTSVLVGNIANSTFNGFYTITVPAANKIRYTTETSGNIEASEAGEGAYVLRSLVEMTGIVPQQDVASGEASVAGSLPFSSANGTATVSPDVQRTLSQTGVVVKRNEVRFTPGIPNGVVSVDPSILEIDTKDREVAFNGELIGARSRIDVLADFIQLAPGENVIEFEDTGNPESEATLKVYYRSGWLS